MRIRIFQRGKISGSRTVDHQIFSTYTFTKCQIIFVLRKNSGESISYPFAFGIEGLSNFRRDAWKEQFGKEPSTVRCLAVKSALLGTRHPRKEKEAALQNVTGEPACLCGKISMCHTTVRGTKNWIF